MRWKKFKGQKLETGDIIMTNHGLAFIDSAYTTEEPSRISSIPESWSWSFENGDINRREPLVDGKFVHDWISPDDGTIKSPDISDRIQIQKVIKFI